MRGYWQLNAVLFLQQKIPHLIHYLQYNIEKQHNHTSMHEYMTVQVLQWITTKKVHKIRKETFLKTNSAYNYNYMLHLFVHPSLGHLLTVTKA